MDVDVGGTGVLVGVNVDGVPGVVETVCEGVFIVAVPVIC